jgi:hypothetical protein
MTLIFLAISLTITFCVIAWHLAIYALPVMVLCGRQGYVAHGDIGGFRAHRRAFHATYFARSITRYRAGPAMPPQHVRCVLFR